MENRPNEGRVEVKVKLAGVDEAVAKANELVRAIDAAKTLSHELAAMLETLKVDI